MKTLSTVGSFLRKYGLIILILLCGLLTWQTCNLRSANKYLTAKTVADNTKFTTWRDSMGRENAKQRLQTVYITQLDPTARKRLDEEAHNIGIKPESISNLTQVSTETKGKFHATIDPEGDWHWTDNFLTLKGSNSDSATGGTYVYKDTATIATYDTARRFLGIKYRTDQYMNVRFNNPNTSITGLSNISLKDYQRPKHWVVSAGAGYGLTPTGLNWNVSINVGYKLFEF